MKEEDLPKYHTNTSLNNYSLLETNQSTQPVIRSNLTSTIHAKNLSGFANQTQMLMLILQLLMLGGNSTSTTPIRSTNIAYGSPSDPLGGGMYSQNNNPFQLNANDW